MAQAVEKIGKSCFIKFTPEFVAFGAIHGLGDTDPATGGGTIQCWSVQSLSNNEVYMEMKVEDLLVAMRSCSNASAILMRMTGQSSDAYLTFTITTE
ncbi:hypothetical protein BGZ65_006255, partial [Modicella reniformis]